MLQSWWSKARNAHEPPRRSLPDWVVVTSAGGARAAAKTDWKPLAEVAEWLIWPDADEAGRTYADDVASILHGLGVPDIRVVDANALASRAPDGTTREPPLGWDVADAVDRDGWDAERLREAVLAHCKSWSPPAADPQSGGAQNGGIAGKNPRQVDILLSLMAAAALFHTRDGTGFADLVVNGHRETWPVRSKVFRRWLSLYFHETTQGAPSSEALQSSLT